MNEHRARQGPTEGSSQLQAALFLMGQQKSLQRSVVVRESRQRR